MKKLLIFGILSLFVLPSFAVDQKYMPDGYVRDDVIYPYYAEYLSRYFQKVDNGQVDCTWAGYRREVEAPLRKVKERLHKESMQGLYPKRYNY